MPVVEVDSVKADLVAQLTKLSPGKYEDEKVLYEISLETLMTMLECDQAHNRTFQRSKLLERFQSHTVMLKNPNRR